MEAFRDGRIQDGRSMMKGYWAEDFRKHVFRRED
jgi:hypothetical protein